MKRRTVSLCMIARDEEASIGQAIKSALALVDEVIVVDTGSRDNTRIIAEGYGARIIDCEWRDDFAAARNAALEEAFGDWILVLDADERLQPMRPIDFQRLLNVDRVIGYRIEVAGRPGGPGASADRPVRLFRNHPEARYRYPIHEQIVPALAALAAAQGLVIQDADLILVHAGSARDRANEKRDRNLRILRRAIQDFPAEPYFEYQLASDSLALLDDEVLPVAGSGQTLATLLSAWQKLQALPAAERVRLPYGPDLAAKVAGCQAALGDHAAARQSVESARQLYGDEPRLLLAGIAATTGLLVESAAELPPAEVRRRLQRARAEIALLRDRSAAPSSPLADRRRRDLYPLRYEGELALVEGRVEEAAELFEKALTVDGGYSSAWLGLAECARYAGDRKRALQLYLRAVTANEANPRAWLRGGDVLDELGFHDNAASWRRQVALRFPEHPACTGRAAAPLPSAI